MTWQAQIDSMGYAERVGRCVIRVGKRTGPITWNSTATLLSSWLLDFMEWLLTPFADQPGRNLPRRVICMNGNQEEVLIVSDVLDELGTSLNTDRDTDESDFDYSGRLLAA